MIDTVCLLIPKDKMVYLSGSSIWDLQSKTELYSKYVRNPSKVDKQTGRYFPRLTGYKRTFSEDKNVRIELSLPKLLYLNNLDELEDSDFPEIITKLHERLKMMGIIAEKNDLENASVSSVHFSRNILLENNYTANYIISEINKVNLTKTFDFTRARYINDGQSLYAHATTHQFIIYDKIADLNKDKKRAIDKDQDIYQRSLFEELHKQKEIKDIIRFEVRLSQKQKMNKTLEELGYEKNPTLKNIFSSSMSQKVILSYWDKIIKEESLGLFSIPLDTKEALQNLFMKNASIKPKQAIYLAGLLLLSKEDYGIRELRTIVSKKSNNRTWYRIKNDIKQINKLATRDNLRDWVVQIDRKLQNYKPYKIKNNNAVEKKKN
jgi:hypothetical protein